MSERDPSEEEQSSETEKPDWVMFAGRDKENAGFSDFFDHPEYVKMYGHQEIVLVDVTEDAEGPYYGWLQTGENRPSLIQPREIMYSTQFAYGPERAEAAGQGRTIRLSVEEIKLD